MTEIEQEELTLLKERANLMGIQYHPSIGLNTLREKVKSALDLDASNKPQDTISVDMSEFVETLGQKKARLKKEAEKLVRIRISCMNPTKAEIPGEVVCVGNKFIGQITQYVPFNNEPIHVRQIILDRLQERTYTHHYTAQGKTGKDESKNKQVREFNIEILPFLTEEEIKDLAHQQAITDRLKDGE